jgi:hypothetical protein
MPDVVVPAKLTNWERSWFPGVERIDPASLAIEIQDLIRFESVLSLNFFEHDHFEDLLPPRRKTGRTVQNQDLVAGEHLDLGVNAGNDLEDALVRLVVVAGDGPILALRQDHAREGTG